MPCIVSILVTTCPVRRQRRRRCKNLKVIYKNKARVFHHVSPGVTEHDSGPSQLCHRVLITACFMNQEGQVELTFLLSGASSEHQLVCVWRPAAVEVLHPAASSGLMASAASLECVRQKSPRTLYPMQNYTAV